MTDQVTDQALFVDQYIRDTPLHFPTMLGVGRPWRGWIGKVAEGVDYEYVNWAHAQLTAVGSSPGYDPAQFLVALYTYHRFGDDPVAECDWFVKAQERAAVPNLIPQRGWMPGMLDVERGGQRVLSITHTMWEHDIGAFAMRYTQLTGDKATLYEGELGRSVGSTGLYGCGRGWVALYTPELHGPHESTQQFLARQGLTLADTDWWQYTGAQGAYLKGYAAVAPGIGGPGRSGPTDISAYIKPGGFDALQIELGHLACA